MRRPGAQRARGADRPLLDWLAGALQDKQLLLILDNFEHVADARRSWATCCWPAPRSTSWSPAGRCWGSTASGSSRCPLEPARPGAPAPREQLAQFEAVRLFVERAQDINPAFRITDQNARAVAEICARLDGCPWPSSWRRRCRLLSPQAMLERLDRLLPLLTGGARDLPARQQTLRNAIAWSYDLLDGEQQTLFRQLSVFAGSCTLTAAEAICDPTGDPATGVLDGLESLFGKSLLRRIDPGAPARTAWGRPAGGVLRPLLRAGHRHGPGRRDALPDAAEIREYAAERLEESGEAGRIQRPATRVLHRAGGDGGPEAARGPPGDLAGAPLPGALQPPPGPALDHRAGRDQPGAAPRRGPGTSGTSTATSARGRSGSPPCWPCRGAPTAIRARPW